MKLRQFIKEFDFNKPNWGNLPEGFPECDLEGLSLEEVAKFNAIKTLWELSQPEKPKASREFGSQPTVIFILLLGRMPVC